MNKKFEVKINKVTTPATKKYGVYFILVNGIVTYVGSGDIKDCISRHKSNLKNNAYFSTNKKVLQEAYNNNPDSITYDEKEYVSDDINDPKIVKMEDYYIDLHKDTICNVRPAQRPLRSNDPEKRETEYKKRSEVNSADKNPHYSGKLKVPEDIQYQRNIKSYKVLAKLQGVLIEMLLGKSIEYRLIHCKTWKSKCNIKVKEDSIKFVKEQFGIEVNNDIADAICLGISSL